MKRFITFILTLITISAFTSCGGKEDNGKLKIVTTLFPQYDFASCIAGDKAEVTMLLPYGSDIHTFEPSVKDMTDVATCDIFIYTGSMTEPWAATLLENADSDGTAVLDLSKNIHLIEGEVHALQSHVADGHTHDYDPHFWTSPKNALVMVDEILGALCTIDEQNTEYYIKNAQNLKVQLAALDSDLSQLSDGYDGTPLYFGGKFAFLYMFSDYGFNYRSPYQGCSDESEPGIKTITEMCESVKNDGVKYIFTQEMSENKVAKSIAEETGTELLVLHSCHNLSVNEAKAGENYISIMEKNIQNIRLAMTARK